MKLDKRTSLYDALSDAEARLETGWGELGEDGLAAIEEELGDKLQSVLWCVHQIVSMRRIAKPRHPFGLIVAELDAIIELQIFLAET
jgi:hypothetical protein